MSEEMIKKVEFSKSYILSVFSNIDKGDKYCITKLISELNDLKHMLKSKYLFDRHIYVFFAVCAYDNISSKLLEINLTKGNVRDDIRNLNSWIKDLFSMEDIWEIVSFCPNCFIAKKIEHMSTLLYSSHNMDACSSVIKYYKEKGVTTSKSFGDKLSRAIVGSLHECTNFLIKYPEDIKSFIDKFYELYKNKISNSMLRAKLSENESRGVVTSSPISHEELRKYYDSNFDLRFKTDSINDLFNYIFKKYLYLPSKFDIPHSIVINETFVIKFSKLINKKNLRGFYYQGNKTIVCNVDKMDKEISFTDIIEIRRELSSFLFYFFAENVIFSSGCSIPGLLPDYFIPVNHKFMSLTDVLLGELIVLPDSLSVYASEEQKEKILINYYIDLGISCCSSLFFIKICDRINSFKFTDENCSEIYKTLIKIQKEILDKYINHTFSILKDAYLINDFVLNSATTMDGVYSKISNCIIAKKLIELLKTSNCKYILHTLANCNPFNFDDFIESEISKPMRDVTFLYE